mgnify:CR=1 FL=1
MINRRRFFQSSLAAAVAYALPAPRLYALDQSASQAAGGLAAVKLDGSATVIEQAALAELKGSLRGPLLVAGDAGYEEARRVLNRSIDRRPALVVQPTGVADVRYAVDFARERELVLAVKCGGHSYGGKSTCAGLRVPWRNRWSSAMSSALRFSCARWKVARCKGATPPVAPARAASSCAALDARTSWKCWPA